MLSEPSSHSAWPGGAASQPRWAAPWRREAAAWAGLQSGAPRWKYTVSTTRLHPCIVSRRRARFSHSPAGTGLGVPDCGAGTKVRRTQDFCSRSVKFEKCRAPRQGMWNKVLGRLGLEHLAPGIPPPPTHNVGIELQPFRGSGSDISACWRNPGWNMQRVPAGLVGGHEVVAKGQSESQTAPHTQTRIAPFFQRWG